MKIADKIKNRGIYDVPDFDEGEDKKSAYDSEAYVPEDENTFNSVYDDEQDPEGELNDHTSISEISKTSDTAFINSQEENQRQISHIDIEKTTQFVATEIENIIQYISHKGKNIPEGVGALLQSKNISHLFKAHTELCEIIKPATPETIQFVSRYNQSSKKFYLFSPIPLVRNFIIIAIIAIASLIGIGTSPEVNTESLSKGILNNAGIPLLKNLIFLCSSAIVGAIFFLMSKLTQKVKESTLSRDDTTYYWAMLIMGMLSGLILSEIIVLNQDNIGGESIEMNRLLFALLGGFSSEVVYSILQAIMNKIRLIITGNEN